MMKEVKITARFVLWGSAKKKSDSICFFCRHGFYCVMIRALHKGLLETQAGYHEALVEECSLYERDKSILGQEEG